MVAKSFYTRSVDLFQVLYPGRSTERHLDVEDAHLHWYHCLSLFHPKVTQWGIGGLVLLIVCYFFLIVFILDEVHIT